MTCENRNEGEGNRTAAKEYNERTKQFVEAKAKEAAAALDRTEGEDLRQAEAECRAHAHEEDPEVRREK